jgi:hypothetical protein
MIAEISNIGVEIYCVLKTETYIAIEAFTNKQIDPALILRFMNQPDNALLLQHDVHWSFDQSFGWGIEAITDSDGRVSFCLSIYLMTIILNFSFPGVLFCQSY